MTEALAHEEAIPDELIDLFVGLQSLQQAEDGYQKAHNYFTGAVPEFFASAKLARRVEKTGTSFRVNIAKKAVTNLTNRMEIGALTCISGSGTSQRAAKANARLTRILHEQIVKPNELTLEIPDWLERTGEYGDGYVFVWPGEEWDGQGTPTTVDIHFNRPTTTRAIYDPENPRRIAYVIKSWEAGAGRRKRTRVNLYYFGRSVAGEEIEPGRVEKWVTKEGTDGKNPEQWEQWTGADGESDPVVPNPFGQIIYHLRTGRPYGVPLHREAYGAQDAINKLIVSLMTTVDFHLIPQRAALTDGDTDDEDDDFDDFGDDDEETPSDARRPGESGMSKLRTGPGELWILKNTKSLVQLPAADPRNFLDPTEFFMRMMAQVTDQPLHMFDPGGDQPSGDSRRQAEGSATTKVDRLIEGFEATISGVLTKAMHILGYTEVTEVHVEWNPTQTVDDSEGWTTAQAKIDAGVPVGQVLQEMGYEAEQVEAWLTGNDEQDLTRRVKLLAELAKAVRDLGTGVGMGVLPPELVQQVIGGMMGSDPVGDGGSS